MAVRARLRSAVATDTGRRRTNNEDRYYVNPDLGIFAVVDGVGGHAAGEHAAETAVEVLRERLERQTGTPEDRLRESIALANNEIYRQARSRPDWNGMACVLTVALIEDDVVTVGHVGDSRLYLLRPGQIRKMTSDHSPVGEREDRGELSEAEAMRHPRRNEIYRDAGSAEREPHDPAFIEILSFAMPSDGAILLCSDGLSDLIGREEIRAGVERYAPDYEGAIEALIDAANHAGGKDNITVVLVAAPDYKPQAAALPLARPRGQRTTPAWLLVLAGVLIGATLAALVPFVRGRLAATGPRTFTVGPAGINAALNLAHSGDTVLIPEGKYKERVLLREGVALRAQQPSTVTLSSPDGQPAVTALKIETGSIDGVWIQDAGIEIVDASPVISNMRITGAAVGIAIRGASAPQIVSNQIRNNSGPGIEIGPGSKPKIESNTIAANGNGKPGEPKPGVEVLEGARPVLKDNAIVNNAAEPIRIESRTYTPADYEENYFGGVPPLTPAQAIHYAGQVVAPAHSKPGGR